MDSEIWIYLAIIAIAVVYFLWNKGRINRDKADRKNKTFRERYQERKKKG
jgi:cbb3-type cytochrome oxidase subunit 3